MYRHSQLLRVIRQRSFAESTMMVEAKSGASGKGKSCSSYGAYITMKCSIRIGKMDGQPPDEPRSRWSLETSYGRENQGGHSHHILTWEVGSYDDGKRHFAFGRVFENKSLHHAEMS